MLCFTYRFCAAGAHDPDTGSVGTLPAGRFDPVLQICHCTVYLWFPWIPFTLFYLLYKAPREDFWRLCIPLFTGMTMTLLFYAIVPNGLALRPKYVPGTDILRSLCG